MLKGRFTMGSCKSGGKGADQNTNKMPLSKDGTAQIAKSAWGTNYDDGTTVTNFKLWENYGKKRIYVTDYQGRKLAYIDCNNNNSIEMLYDNTAVQKRTKEICDEFIKKYKF